MVGQPGLTVTLSPRGASAIPDGKPAKALSMMAVAGVLAWITGRWWASETPFTEGVVPMTVSVATLAVLTVPAQLIGGRATRPWAMALAAASTFTLVWWVNLALRRPDSLALTTLLLCLVALVTVFGTSWVTRAAALRWSDA